MKQFPFEIAYKNSVWKTFGHCHVHGIIFYTKLLVSTHCVLDGGGLVAFCGLQQQQQNMTYQVLFSKFPTLLKLYYIWTRKEKSEHPFGTNTTLHLALECAQRHFLCFLEWPWFCCPSTCNSPVKIIRVANWYAKTCFTDTLMPLFQFNGLNPKPCKGVLWKCAKTFLSSLSCLMVQMELVEVLRLPG